MSEVIETLLQRIKYKEYLQKEPKFDQRWENVKELINFSALVAESPQDMTAQDFAPQEQRLPSSLKEGSEVGGEQLDEVKMLETPETKTSSANLGNSTNAHSDKTPKGESEVINLASSDEEAPSSSKRRQRSQSLKDTEPSSKVKRAKAEVLSPSKVSPLISGEEKRVDANEAIAKTSALHQFLEASTLHTDMEQDDEDGKMAKVTIATNHAAKG